MKRFALLSAAALVACAAALSTVTVDLALAKSEKAATGIGALKGDGEAASSFAPGHVKGDGESAAAYAPGTTKDDDDDGGVVVE